MKAATSKADANIYAWMASRLKIIDKTGDLVPLVPNSIQLRLFGYMARQQAAALPIRIIVLKARREGVSTGVEGLMFGKAYQQPNKRAFVCAHDDAGSWTLFQMNRRFEEELPAEERRATKYSSRKELVWETPHRSQVTVATAGNTELGRSDEIHYLHCSEVAFWKHAKASLGSVLQAVSDNPETMIVLESTANGASGEFYERWEAAVKQQRERPETLEGFYPVFFSWLEYAEYVLPLDEGETLEPLADEEHRLTGLGASLEQLKWRRRVLADKCNGDEDLFMQEYPATPEEAFITSGRPAIPAAIVSYHQSLVCPPCRRVRLLREAVTGAVYAEEVSAEAQYAWEVWNEPKEHHDYAVFGDVAEGGLSDPDNVGSGPDFSAGCVLSRRNIRVDAVWHGQIDPDDFGEELMKAAEWYNDAWATPEVNAAGMAALTPFKKAMYLNLYQRQKPEDSLKSGDDRPLWGWKTTTANRDYMIDTYIAACRADPDRGWADKIQVFSQVLVDEERTFVSKANGKREHQVGYHDDLLFAAMGALQLHLTCPRGVQGPTPDKRTASPYRDMRYSGGVDPGLEIETDADLARVG
ncbi:MAG TPA: hypothetical protein VMY35_12155 [Phycisphaerae bacterium]|nr:hypothetical protein [Phycisphaerae bacterium]